MLPADGHDFGKALRLRSAADFRAVLDERTSVGCRQFVVYGRRTALPHARLGLIVSRKIGSAVARNRWKRRLREAFRASQHDLPRGTDLVIIPKSAEVPTLTETVRQLRDLARRLNRRLQGTQP